MDNLLFMDSSPHSPSQNSPVHLESLFETISSGKPCCFQTSLRKDFATSDAVAFSLRGMKCAILVNLSTTTII